ncbi:3-phosphoshikimate 1-carboxyvinyltransferase [Trueperella bialowiezensis]|uniref:3-phosphoshikimate 1-carboxyvinyltransferase n=1 Tax=Trueperella bialowiezensis TaxID=312285 RepID=A0A448PFK1_9ACTO|nr:3-phosphoshikimate 1-carboxyvinyltransferase [Trueperella bialowiezensis]VEI13725.1 3-phosphoshikimate 1-carboxyvinyltransferase [Trueperella bialowiezensis]
MTWAAPHCETVTATVELPGSKSLTNRYLVLAALGDKPTTIHHPLVARDTELMAGALEALGAAIERSDDDTVWTVHPGAFRGGRVDCGLAGTVMRFIPPLAAFASEPVTFDGDPAARVRPMSAIVGALRDLGVQVDAASYDGAPVLPITVRGTGEVSGGQLEIDASASSQFVSALLLAAPRMTRGLDLRHVGGTLPSQPHIDMTVTVLREAGIDVVAEPTRWIVTPGIPRLPDVTIEPDLSNAGAFLAAAMVTGGSVSVPRWPEHTTQPGDAYRQIFADMGGHVSLDDGVLSVTGPQQLVPYDADMNDVGELVPTVAAVAAFAPGTSRLRNIGQLRGHETNRLAAIVTELGKVGVPAREEGDDLVITGTPTRAAVIESYDDHRMATFGAILGLRIPGIRVTNIDTTAKTLPGFANMWTAAFGEACDHEA